MTLLGEIRPSPEHIPSASPAVSSMTMSPSPLAYSQIAINFHPSPIAAVRLATQRVWVVPAQRSAADCDPCVDCAAAFVGGAVAPEPAPEQSGSFFTSAAWQPLARTEAASPLKPAPPTASN